MTRDRRQQQLPDPSLEQRAARFPRESQDFARAAAQPPASGPPQPRAAGAGTACAGAARQQHIHGARALGADVDRILVDVQLDVLAADLGAHLLGMRSNVRGALSRKLARETYAISDPALER